MRAAAVGSNVLVPAILVREASEESFASHTSGDVGDCVFARSVAFCKVGKKFI